ncbi:hypothetical protein BpHYR1_043037 [Brachionus plicatilis]|uniref:Uncharacterized protein n=1 Tax=Brachionus plicatilis TaxID=10195 RepID=A0A3M7QMD4_BRAPC|nr:hypothetical protein BpHYR1_043037 [Brachionus plicatilis]
MNKSNIETIALPKLFALESNEGIRSELTIDKLKNEQKISENASEFTTVSSLGSNDKFRKISRARFQTNFSHRLCFSNHIPLRFYSNKTLLSNWFEDRLHLEDKLKNLSKSSLINKKTKVEQKMDFKCFVMRIEIDHKFFYLTSQFPHFLDLNFIKKINEETSESSLRFFRVRNGLIEDNFKSLTYSENVCILTCDRKYCLSSGSDFLDREKSSGLLSVHFVSIDDRIGSKSVWTIEPKESKHDRRIILEKSNTPIDRNDLVLIKNYVTNKYICVAFRNRRPKIVLDRLYSRINQNVYWKI